MLSGFTFKDSLFIPFYKTTGEGIADNQGQLIMFLNVDTFYKNFPSDYINDAVVYEYLPVIRCKDCRHWTDKVDTQCDKFHKCDYWNNWCKGDGFCQAGEKGE